MKMLGATGLVQLPNSSCTVRLSEILYYYTLASATPKGNVTRLKFRNGEELNVTATLKELDEIMSSETTGRL